MLKNKVINFLGGYTHEQVCDVVADSVESNEKTILQELNRKVDSLILVGRETEQFISSSLNQVEQKIDHLITSQKPVHDQDAPISRASRTSWPRYRRALENNDASQVKT